MHFSTNFRGSRRLPMLAAAALLATGLAGCSSLFGDSMDEAAGSAFTQALQTAYTEQAGLAAELPAEEVESSIFDIFSSTETTSDLLEQAFTAKAELAAEGAEPEPEAASNPNAETVRARLIMALAAGKNTVPDLAARAQVDYDCWILYGTVAGAANASQACKTSLDSSLLRLEAAARPAPPAPAPAPMSAPLPAPAPAPAPAPDFTVYFDFDSWTLKAEQLTVLTNVINSARTGGQSNINIVGHTDSSGDADYNQRLSVQRANVVVEALVQMGARRAALHASGVGETDLAVQTGDGVREERNRRTVISLQP